MKITALAVILCAVLLPGCTTGNNGADRGTVATLRDYMVGAYTTSKQAAADPENVHDLRLEVLQLWPDRADGTWLYLEHAAAGNEARPYSQRVYRITDAGEHTFQADIYTLPEPAIRYANAHQNPAALAALRPELLTRKDGCTLTITWHNCRELFTAATTGQGCESTSHGAAYATSELSISPYGIVAWDRGFDRSGNQVWGPKADGYIFVKQVYEH